MRISQKRRKHLLLNHPSWLVMHVPAMVKVLLHHREFVQMDILDGSPHNSQATGFRREHVDLIGTLPHIAEEALDGIGRLNVAVHWLRKGIKGQQVLFILNQAAYRFWIALSVLGLEGCQFYQRLLFGWLLPDANEFSLDVATLSPRDRVEDVTLLMH